MSLVLPNLIAKYLQWDKNEKTRSEIQTLVDKKDEEALKARMIGQLAFGTAGIRARVEGGFNRLNYLTVIQITHGFAMHLKNVFGNGKIEVVIGYDGRFDSKAFAEYAANVFTINGIGVYLFSDVVPTPVVSYSTAYLKCQAGLMVTASHNPKEDNGYKAYWSNGAQIVAPHDIEICRIAYAEAEPKSEYWNKEQIHQSNLLYCADSAIDKYFESELSRVLFSLMNSKCRLRFTYSAFHGVGYKFFKRMFTGYGFSENNLISVKQQQDPDPTFSTVPFPNPEEGAKVLKLCFETADANGSTIILANDPDADRIQLAEKQPNGEWRVFTGNEMGTLLTWWIFKNYREQHPVGDFSKVWILNSAVSSQIVKTMANAEGFQNQITLTGFKWMGNLASELRAKGNDVILAWEESIGFMPGSSLDKDGVIAAAMFAELASFLEHEGISLAEKLLDIYHDYGFHLVRSSYFMVPSPSITKQLFNNLRLDLNYPKTIGNDEVKYVRDLTTGYDNQQLDNKAVLPLSTSSEMITFTLVNGSIVTLRASGTEPKIKYYIELITEPGKDADEASKALDKLEHDVIEDLLQPSKYGLIARS
uniref:Phosphoglucomutase n=1 Tax=Panagrolaimus sp. JU765 TaxID=591449 RepID=A0AC34QK24_9BILA